MRKRVMAVGALVVLTGCAATPAPLGLITQSASPRREVLQYFPGDAPVVALVQTDPTEPAVRRLLNSGVLGPLRGWATAQSLRFSQYRALLGNEAAVGELHVGGPPLLVLVTRDGHQLEDLADARTVGGLAVKAQEYRGAQLYDAGTWAFAIRGPVLLVGRTTGELSEALDTRTKDSSYDMDQLDAVAPAASDDDVARGVVDLTALLAFAPSAARQLPLAQAVGDAGFTIRSEPGGQLVGALTAKPDDDSLTESDLPPHGAGPVRLLDTDAVPVVGVDDVGTARGPAQKALRAALPVSALQLEAITERLRHAGVNLDAATLAGPAWALDTPRGPQVLWHPRYPASARADLARLADYRQPGVTVAHNGAFYDIVAHGHLVTRIGFVDGTVVAGDAPVPDLRFLARSKEIRVRGGTVAVRVPRRGFLPRLLTIAAHGDAGALHLRVNAAP
jgi:hypothetical protein